MSIQILPIQLANQIAAGEVVERPASVVKELVENSLDSGASQIEIEIEKGGHKRICIRDNGCGIDKQELGLALSRHATSKICQLDDLENIISLGFRGEALASISSVSRLTLTSKPAEQDAAWQACAQGRDMQVDIQPAAHPNGTSVDVVDLFFNTPARRKFLRAEKTEFMHIDEVIRRIALSRHHVGFVLKHNGKVVRKYPALKTDGDPLKRVAAICSSQFADAALYVKSEYQDLSLHGWMSPPSQGRNQNDIQYFYVNGRMMRDKLINHAIRQAFEGLLGAELHPAYVLYLNIDPHQVDVNVHPAKHEVRFHQARLVHDFIFRALNDGLNQSMRELSDSQDMDQHVHHEVVNHDYIRPLIPNNEATHTAMLNPSRQVEEPIETQSSAATTNRSTTWQPRPSGTAAYSAGSYSSHSVDQRAAHNYQALMRAPAVENEDATFVFPVDNQWILAKVNQHTYKLSVAELLGLQIADQLKPGEVVSQPLLMPVSVTADKKTLAYMNEIGELLAELGLHLAAANQRILVKQVPAGMRQMNWADIIDELLCAVTGKASRIESADDLGAELIAALAKVQCQQAIHQANFAANQALWLQQQRDINDIVSKLGQQVELSDWLSKHD